MNFSLLPHAGICHDYALVGGCTNVYKHGRRVGIDLAEQTLEESTNIVRRVAEVGCAPMCWISSSQAWRHFCGGVGSTLGIVRLSFRSLIDGSRNAVWRLALEGRFRQIMKIAVRLGYNRSSQECLVETNSQFLQFNFHLDKFKTRPDRITINLSAGAYFRNHNSFI